jgi:hypothetical protein
MVSVSRRALLAGTAATALASPATTAFAAKGSPEKRAFMQAVIKDLNVDLNSTEEAQKRAQIQRVCIPVPFADFDYYYTLGTLAWSATPGLNLPDTTVPNGFCTDLASVPRLYWSLLPKTGKYAYAAIVHDYLYWTQTTTRQKADEVLKAAMQDSNVGTATITAIYLSVRGFGASAWTANAKAKQAGEKRFLKTFPADGQLVSWADWKKDRSRFSD